MKSEAACEKTKSTVQLKHFKIFSENVDEYLQPESFRMGDCYCDSVCQVDCMLACMGYHACETVCQVSQMCIPGKRYEPW